MSRVNQLKRKICKIDSNIEITAIFEKEFFFGIEGVLESPIPKCLNCNGEMAKYDFQRVVKSPIGQVKNKAVYLFLKKRRFKCKSCRKVIVSTSPLIGKTSQISSILEEDIRNLEAQNYSMSKISKLLPVSYSTVQRVLKKED